MNYEFHPEAEIEFFEAIGYFEGREGELGRSFAREVFSAIRKVTFFPFAWTPISRNSRRILVKKFPYGVIYHVRDKDILIVAVMHLSRKPNYWESRTK